MSTLVPRRVSQGFSNWFGSDPFSNFRQEMDQMMRRFDEGWNGGQMTELTLPSTDISETDDSIEVKMNVPGLKSEELSIEVRGNMLQVSGEHKEEQETKEKTYHRVERRQGKLFRAITLPSDVDETKVQATCRDGVLTISLPKAEKSKMHKISVKSEG